MKKRIVTTTSVFEPGYPAEKAALRLKKLGYEALDIALDYWNSAENSPFLKEDYLAWAEGLRVQAQQAGIPYTHAHAPGEALHNPHIERSIRTAGALGAKYLVLHPVCRDEQGEIIEDRDAFIRLNGDAVRPWLGLARECGVVLLSENLLWGASKDPRIIAELVQTVDSPWFGWCYDAGHANCFDYSPDVLRACVVPPASLHLQDNHGELRDEHLIPGEGTVDWAALVSALIDIGYAGDCVLEAHHQSLEAPDEERDEILARLLDSARKLQKDMQEGKPMDTIKIHKGKTQMVAHAGLAGMEMANTNAGFIAAGNRSYYGIETDVHVTRDKQFVVVHDDDMERISGVKMMVEESTLAELQQIPLYDEPFFYDMEKYGVQVQKGVVRSDLRTPSLREYIHICQKYGKEAVLELKSRMTEADIACMVEQIRAQDYLEHVTFISFHWDNLTAIRKLVPAQKVQFLTGTETEFTDAFIDEVARQGFDLDIHVFTTTRELIERLHDRGIRVNVWTIDWPEMAEKIAGWGADYITSNILE